MKARYKFLRCLAYFLGIVVSYALQMTPGLLPRIFGALPLLILPIALTVSMLEDEITGLAFGLFCGLLIDFGMGSLLGFHALLLGLLCYLVGILCVNLVKTNLFTAVLFSLLVTFILYSLQFFFFYFLRGYDLPGHVYVRYYLPRMAYTWIVTPVFYLINRAFVRWIRARDD